MSLDPLQTLFRRLRRRPSIYFDVPTILTIASRVDYPTAATVDIGRNNDDLRACRQCHIVVLMYRSSNTRTVNQLTGLRQHVIGDSPNGAVTEHRRNGSRCRTWHERHGIDGPTLSKLERLTSRASIRASSRKQQPTSAEDFNSLALITRSTRRLGCKNLHYETQ